MDFWSSLQVHKWQSAVWILLYIMSLIFIFRNRKRWAVDCISILIFTVITGILFYCPIFAKIMELSFLPSHLEYERVSWLLFINPICALVIVKILHGLEKKQRKRAIILLFIAGIMASNVTLVTRDYTVADNYYKVPDDVVIISEALVDDSSCDDLSIKPMVFVQEDEDYGYVGNAMYHGIRQYTSGPILSKIVISPKTYQAKNFQLADYGLMNYKYFVCHNKAALRKQAEKAGFTLLVKTDEYCLYRNDKEIAVYFVRHGQTDANVAGIYAGSGTDAMLTDEGILQAKASGEALSEEKFSEVYTSEMTRASDTANYILKENNNDIPKCQKNSYLNDFYWGDLEGVKADEVAEIYPDFTMDGYIGTATDSSFVSPINGWSKKYTISRYKNAFCEIAADVTNNGNALVVGHSAMVWYFQQMFPEQVSEDAGLDNASITILHYDRGRWTLEYLNLSAEEYEELGL